MDIGGSEDRPGSSQWGPGSWAYTYSTGYTLSFECVGLGLGCGVTLTVTRDMNDVDLYVVL